MSDIPKVKHITMTCTEPECTNKAFVQVVIVDDPNTQKEIDKRARRKLRTALTKAHKEAQHD